MAFIIICTSFYISLSFQDVEAQTRRTDSTSSGQQACCEQTKSGDSCVYTDKNNCNKDFRTSLTTCENTNYCSLGTCIYDKEGECFSNTPKSLCEKNKGVWSSEFIDDILQCKRGCCQISNQCSFVTQAKCKSETSKFPYVSMLFNKDVNNEAQCIDQCRSEEKGACVSNDGSCTFTTRNSCIEKSETVLDNGTKATLKTGFHVNVLCSNPLLGTNCARQQKTNCLNEKVYWFDSCGNPENVYDSNKDKSYNNGFILEESKSCILTKPNDVNCGNCNYAQGNLCGKSPSSVNMKFGEYSCNDLSCKQTTTNIASPDSNGVKETGESWCLYDARVGFGQDVVGSRHYRSLCLNGEEVVEPCKDFREEICIQGTSGAINNFNLGQAFKIQDGYLEAACRTNRFKECNTCNSVGGNCGGECNNYKGQERVACCKQTCCNNVENKDCYFMPSGVSDSGGMCVPMVPPGLRFWESGEKGGGSKEGTQTGAQSVCSEGSNSCDVKFVRGGTARIGIGGLGTAEDWECVGNCQCLDKSWAVAAAIQCKARGDCGAKYNIQGKFTSGGIGVDAEDEYGNSINLGQKDFEDWSTLAKQDLRKDDPTNLGAFFARTWPAFIVIFGTATAASIFSSSFSAFGSGLILGPKFVTILGQPTVESTFLEAFRTGIQTKNLNLVPNLGPNGGAMFAEGFVPDSATQLLYTSQSDKVAWYWADASGKALAPATDAQVALATETFSSGIVTATIALLQVINILSWLYTIYSLADIIFKESKTVTMSVNCSPWEAPKGGEDCEKCNESGKTCSEYSCRSLGSLCRLINQGTEDEKCIAQSQLDVNSPIITAIKPKNLEIQEQKNQGYIIKTLIKPFTPVELGISTDEPSKCKFDSNISIKFENMKNEFGDNLYRYNHTLLFSLPSELQQEQVLKLTNGGKYNLYVKCKDSNDNANERDYYIRFEVDKGSDLTPPNIELTSIKNNGFVANDVKDIGLDIFVTEPSECRWDTKDVDFDLMNQRFICPTSGLQVTPIKQGLYGCGALLNNLQKGKNTFYFRCKDKPGQNSDRNVNKESYKFELTKTEKLTITSALPTGRVFQSNPKLVVKTSSGAENGISICGISTNKNVILANIPLFLNTNSTEHTQQLRNLKKGSYTYYITCVDKAGNVDKKDLSFDVISEVTNQNVISQIYKDTKTNLLIIGTNEDSSCQFDSKQFSFGDGIAMTDPNTKNHQTLLTNNIYYVICKDIFNIQESATVMP